MTGARARASLGRRGERAALRYMKKQGCKRIAANYRVGHDELDLILKDGEQTVFVEVKTRTYDEENIKRYGSAADAVDREKKAHLVYAVRSYVKRHPEAARCRIDVIEVYYPKKLGLFTRPKIHHIKSAIGADAGRYHR